MTRFRRYPAMLIITVFTFLLTFYVAENHFGILLVDITYVLWLILFFYYSDIMLFLLIGWTKLMRLRKQLNYILNENPIFLWGIISLLFISLILIVIENVLNLPKETKNVIERIDNAILLIFLLEFYLRYIASGEDKNKHLSQASTIIDLMALFPLLRVFRLLRFIRFLRFLRIANLKRYFQTLAESMACLAALWSENVFNFVIIVILSVSFLIFGSITIYHIEISEQTFMKNFSDAIWWSISMLFAGQPLDIVGHNRRIIGGILMLSGIIITSILTGTVAATLSERLQSIKKGNTHYSFRDHIVICGWRDEAAEMVNYLHQHMGRRRKHIIVVDDVIDELPVIGRDVYFVRGNPASENALMRANAQYASAAIVLSGGGEGVYADQKAILSTLAVESLSRKKAGRDIHTCSELLNPLNIENLKRAYVNEIVLIEEHSYDIIAQSVMIPGITELLNELLTNEKGENNIYKIIGQDFDGRSFRDIYLDLSEKNIITIGVLREEYKTDEMGNPVIDEFGIPEVSFSTFINPDGKEFIINYNDKLFVIAKPDDIKGWEVARE